MRSQYRSRCPSDFELIGLLMTISLISKRMAQDMVKNRKEDNRESNQITKRRYRRHACFGG